MNEHWNSIEQRVERSLTRAGFPNLTAIHRGGGAMEVVGKIEQRDLAVVRAITRSVAGVRSFAAKAATGDERL